MHSQKYYAFIDGSQQGPFDLTQLVDAGVRPSTYVWCKGMSDWDRADKVDEIRDLFKQHIQHRQENILNPPAEEKIETVQPEEVHRDDNGNEIPPREEPPLRFGRIPQSVEEEPDLNTPPQVSMALAVLSMLLCFPITGIAAVVFTYKAQKAWRNSFMEKDVSPEALKREAHEYERLAKMWMGISIALGLIFWTLMFSIPRG